jgi:hypothetical protein
MTRKVYVSWYGPLPKDQILPPTRPFEQVEKTGVQYCAEPTWTLHDRPSAEVECATLRNAGIHIGAHYCDFAVESLENGAFAIVCLTHPVDLKLAKPTSV